MPWLKGLEAALAAGGGGPNVTDDSTAVAGLAGVPTGTGDVAAGQGSMPGGGAGATAGATAGGGAESSDSLPAIHSTAGGASQQQQVASKLQASAGNSVGDGGNAGTHATDSVAQVGHASTSILLDDAAMAASQLGARRVRRQHRRRMLATLPSERWRGLLVHLWKFADTDRQAVDED